MSDPKPRRGGVEADVTIGIALHAFGTWDSWGDFEEGDGSGDGDGFEFASELRSDSDCAMSDLEVLTSLSHA